MRAAFGALMAIALLAAACTSGAGSDASASGASAGVGTTTGSAATGSSGQADPLVGIWESGPITAADVDATLRGTFKPAVVDEMEAFGAPCLPKEGETHVETLHFGGGQLVISDAKDGGPSREGWTGSYAVQDANTFAAGDSDLYISVDYTIQGDRLHTDLIADRFPDHTPWSDAQDGPGASKLNGIVDKALADRICQAAIYETTPFTKAG